MEAEYRRYASDRQRRRLNGLMLTVIGGLTSFSDTIIASIIIGAAYVSLLTDELELVGLVPAISVAGFLVASVLISTVSTRRSPRNMAVLFGVIRTGGLAWMTWDSLHGPDNPEMRVRRFLLGLLVVSLASGAATSSGQSLISLSVPIYRRRSTIRNRRVFAGIMAILAGSIAYSVLGSSGPVFPDNFALLFGASALFSGVATFLCSQMKEPQRVSNLRSYSKKSGSLSPLSKSAFRRLLSFRIVLGLAAIADPFFLLWAMDELNVPLDYAGLYVIGLSIAALVTGYIIWRARSAVKPLRLLQSAALIRLAPVLIALTTPYLRDTDFIADRDNGLHILQLATIGIFCAIGVALACQISANFRYVNEIEMGSGSGSYRDIANLTMAIVAFAPVAGGRIVTRYEFDRLFLVSGAFALTAVLLSGLLMPSKSSSTNAPATMSRRPAAQL